MPLAITTLTVHLRGRVADDVTALEIDGAAVAIGANRTWSHAVVATPTAQTVAITATSAGRRTTRLVEVGGAAAPGAPG